MWKGVITLPICYFYFVSNNLSMIVWVSASSILPIIGCSKRVAKDLIAFSWTRILTKTWRLPGTSKRMLQHLEMRDRGWKMSLQTSFFLSRDSCPSGPIGEESTHTHNIEDQSTSTGSPTPSGPWEWSLDPDIICRFSLGKLKSNTSLCV